MGAYAGLIGIGVGIKRFLRGSSDAWNARNCWLGAGTCGGLVDFRTENGAVKAVAQRSARSGAENGTALFG